MGWDCDEGGVVFTSLIHRMILWELVKIFLLALLALTGLMLMATVLTEATRNGLSPTQTLVIIPLLIPSTLPYTLPTTTLFATCVVYGRLAHDNEILAIKAAGINILRVVWPCILLGIIISAVTIGLSYRLIPRTHYLLRAMLVKDIEEFMYGKLKQEGQLSLPHVNYEIYVKRVVGRDLFDALFMRKDPTGQHYDIIASARKAELSADLEKKQIVVHMQNCKISEPGGGGARMYDKQDWPIDIPDEIMHPVKNRPFDMTWKEMLKRRAELNKEIQQKNMTLASQKSLLLLNNPPPRIAEHIQNLVNQKRHLERCRSEVQAEMHQRPALALGCLCFVLLGCPVGIWFSRSDYLSAFITCFLPIVLVYYPLLLCGFNAARFGRTSPVLSVWAANTLLAVCSLPLYRKLLKN
jgi:lipopolysaccharide export system permease protein